MNFVWIIIAVAVVSMLSSVNAENFAPNQGIFYTIVWGNTNNSHWAIQSNSTQFINNIGDSLSYNETFMLQFDYNTDQYMIQPQVGQYNYNNNTCALVYYNQLQAGPCAGNPWALWNITCGYTDGINLFSNCSIQSYSNTSLNADLEQGSNGANILLSASTLPQWSFIPVTPPIYTVYLITWDASYPWNWACFQCNNSTHLEIKLLNAQNMGELLPENYFIFTPDSSGAYVIRRNNTFGECIFNNEGILHHGDCMLEDNIGLWWIQCAYRDGNGRFSSCIINDSQNNIVGVDWNTLQPYFTPLITANVTNGITWWYLQPQSS